MISQNRAGLGFPSVTMRTVGRFSEATFINRSFALAPVLIQKDTAKICKKHYFHIFSLLEDICKLLFLKEKAKKIMTYQL